MKVAPTEAASEAGDLLCNFLLRLGILEMSADTVLLLPMFVLWDKMETEADWLASVNRQLNRTIIDLQIRLKIETEHKERRSIKQLFSLGCGFTGSSIFNFTLASFWWMQNFCEKFSTIWQSRRCRTVDWSALNGKTSLISTPVLSCFQILLNMLLRFVLSKHPLILNLERWTLGKAGMPQSLK